MKILVVIITLLFSTNIFAYEWTFSKFSINYYLINNYEIISYEKSGQNYIYQLVGNKELVMCFVDITGGVGWPGSTACFNESQNITD